MLDRYNSETASSSYHESSQRSAAYLNPSKDNTDDRYIADLPPSISLPRANIATVQRHPTSTGVSYI